MANPSDASGAGGNSIGGAAASGAASGAMAGSMFGPWGTLIGAGVGAGLSAYGKYEEGEANAKMYEYKAAVAQINERIAKQNADYARYAGEVEAQSAGMKLRSELGTIKATQGASGLDVATGSAKAVRDSAFEVGQQNIAMIRSNAAKRAYGFELAAFQATSEGKLAQFAADQSRVAGAIGATSSIIGGATSVSSKWTQYKSAGLVT